MCPPRPREPTSERGCFWSRVSRSGACPSRGRRVWRGERGPLGCKGLREALGKEHREENARGTGQTGARVAPGRCALDAELRPEGDAAAADQREQAQPNPGDERVHVEGEGGALRLRI